VISNDLELFIKDNPQIDYVEAEDGSRYFRHKFYDEKDGTCLMVTAEAFEKVTPTQLVKQVVGGRNVEQMTRITGYFSRVKGWNKGKLGELKDRVREKDLGG